MYVDGVNFNVLVGYFCFVDFGVDVSYFNLYKMFCIFYGGGGFGVGFVGVRVYFVLFFLGDLGNFDVGVVGLVLVVLFGFVGILLIFWMYVEMMGSEVLCDVTSVVIVVVNYIVMCFDLVFLVFYCGDNGWIVYECIIDFCDIIKCIGVIVDDVVKCFMDYGFYVLIMSFFVVGILMIELIESESLGEIDWFCVVMIVIGDEIE